MKYKEVSFSETFPLPSGHYQKIFVTAELEGTDDPRQALYEVKKVVQSFFYESNKAAEKQVKDERPLSTTESMIKDIEQCTDMKMLEAFAFLAKNNSKLKPAYDKRLKELTNG